MAQPTWRSRGRNGLRVLDGKVSSSSNGMTGERAVGRPCLRLETSGFLVVDAPSAPAAELKAAVADAHWWIARKLADECV